MAGFTGTKTQEDIKKNEENKNKNKNIEEKKNATSNKDIYSESTYEEAKAKHGQGVGNNKYFMSKEAWEKGKAEQSKQETPKKEQSLVANQFGDKTYSWEDVKSENGNDPEKILNWLNNNPGYKAGDRTKKGMAEYGYKQDENGKWVKDDSVTNDKVIDKLDEITAGNGAVKAFIDKVTNPKTGDVDEEKAKGEMYEYEKKLVEMGAGSYDENNNFVLKNVNAKGWEDWATVLSAGLSVLGLAFGVPIIPINFRNITNKDERDAKIMELQQQYMDIKAANAGKVEDVKSSAEAGNIVKNNKEDIDAYSEYTENVGGYKAKSDIDTGSEKELIETRTNAQIRADEAQFERTMKQIKSDQDFTLKLEALRERYKEQFAALETALATGSAKELMKYQNAGMFKEMEEMGMTPRKLATWKAAEDSVSPADKNWNRFKIGVDAVNDLVETGTDTFATVTTGGMNKLGNKGK